jgi:hypothetical protein
LPADPMFGAHLGLKGSTRTGSHVAQAIRQTDAEIGGMDHLWMETY